jgi:CBS domain-containing protein
MLVACVCTGKRDGETGEEIDLVTIFPDMSLKQAWRLMQPRGLQQLPVVARGGKRWQERGRKLVGLLDRDCIKRACR